MQYCKYFTYTGFGFRFYCLYMHARMHEQKIKMKKSITDNNLSNYIVSKNNITIILLQLQLIVHAFKHAKTEK